VTEAVMTPDRSEYVTQIHLANGDGSGQRQLTFGDKSCTNPDWSPDGRTIAFTTARSGKSNLYLLPVAGGEAEQRTDVRTGVGALAWSRDGRSRAFTMTAPPTPEEEKAAKGKDDARWVDEEFKMARLYVAPVAKDAAKQEPRRLTVGAFSVFGNF